MKSVNFDFSAKSSNIDYNELNKPTSKPLAHVGSEKSLVELADAKSELFHIFCSTKKFTFHLEP